MNIKDMTTGEKIVIGTFGALGVALLSAAYAAIMYTVALWRCGF